MELNMGVIKPIVKGNWDIAQDYKSLNIVVNNNRAYIANKSVDSLNSIDISDTEYWSPITPELTGDLTSTKNLSDLSDIGTSRTNLGVYSTQEIDSLLNGISSSEVKYNDVAKATATANGIEINGDLVVSGTITESSDKRIKENIETIENPIDLVNLLRGVSYNKIDTKKEEIGLIAQEVEVVVPQIVETDDNGFKSVSYSRVVALLIEAVKKQQEQIDELKRMI